MPGVVNTTDTFTTNQVITSTAMNNIIDQTLFTSDAIVSGNTTLTLVGGKLKVGIITSNEMGGSSVTSNAIAANAITTAKILDANVTPSKLADSDFGDFTVASGVATLDNNVVTTAKIADANITAPKLDGAQTGTAPIYGIRAWANFNTQANTDLTGTYSRSGTTTVTITATAHGLIAGNVVFIDYTVGTGTAPFDGIYEVASVTDANTFTVISTATTASTGTAALRRKTIRASGNISCISAAATSPTIPPTSNDSVNDGFYIANFSIAMPSEDFSILGTCSATGTFTVTSGNEILSGSPINAQSARILCMDNANERSALFNSLAIIG